jgi:hypothetical protein
VTFSDMSPFQVHCVNRVFEKVIFWENNAVKIIRAGKLESHKQPLLLISVKIVQS